MPGPRPPCSTVSRLASLLPVGIEAVEGKFSSGDVIQIRNAAGKVLGCGRARYDHEEARQLMGKRGQKPLVHYDYLYLCTERRPRRKPKPDPDNPMEDKQTYLEQGLAAARQAARGLARCEDRVIRSVLNDLADRAMAASDTILAANRSDLSRMPEDDPKYDRLLLDAARLQAICDDLRSVADLPSPVGEVLERRTLDNGLELSKVRVPMGVIAVIFESRPNVTFDVFALCLKTRNACVLKGSSDAHDTNQVVVRLMHDVLEEHGVNPDAVFLAPPEREWLPKILQAVGIIDLAIPRGSKGLIDFVRDNARIPVIETGAGIVHTYVDASADLDKARAIITNAKTRRVSVCNALDTLIIHRDLLPELPALMRDMGETHGVEVFADEEAFAALDGRYAGPLQPRPRRAFRPGIPVPAHVDQDGRGPGRGARAHRSLQFPALRGHRGRGPGRHRPLPRRSRRRRRLRQHLHRVHRRRPVRHGRRNRHQHAEAPRPRTDGPARTDQLQVGGARRRTGARRPADGQGPGVPTRAGGAAGHAGPDAAQPRPSHSLRQFPPRPGCPAGCRPLRRADRAGRPADAGPGRCRTRT